jgi:hypothetical protein
VTWREWLGDQDASQIDYSKSEKVFRPASEFEHSTFCHTLDFDGTVDRITFLDTFLHDFKFVYRLSFLQRII